MNLFTNRKYIGRGAFAKIYTVNKLEDNVTYVLKEINLLDKSEELIEMMKYEVYIFFI